LFETATLFDAKLFEAAKVLTKLVEGPSQIKIDQLMHLEKWDGKTILAIGKAKGNNKILKAVHQALKTLQNTDLSKASGVLLAIRGGHGLSLSDVEPTVNEVCKNLKPDAYVLWGASVDPELKDSVKVYLMFFGGGK
ncbi:MAG: hypothetical protein L6408_02570, partial [Nanoarchaeota archaeon]|nr:hypothetical protein [Nanoarchaeota archaeon]